MPSEIVINAEPFETRVALLENGVAAELYIERESGKSIVGNIYKGKVTKVLPGMQAAFVDIGLEKAGFLYVSDVDTIEAIENYRKLAAEQLENDDDLDFEGNDFVNGDDFSNGDHHDNDKDEQQNGSPTNLIGKHPRRREKERHIENLLEDGQDVIVQVSKEPLGTKGSRLTSYITLPGRYVVYMPTIKQIGISRRIKNEEERKRLKRLVRKNRQPGAGYIVRTASETMPAQDIEANVNFLHALWEDILNTNESASAPSRIHSNLNIIERTVRDLFNSSVDKMIIDDKEQYRKTREFLQSYYPHLVPKLQHYDGDEPVFDYFGVELELERALGQRVWLRNGGYIMIDQTEALTTVDVNTGRFVGHKNPEDTILETNLEAVREIVSQLRLRNLGGIIIVDFIDMETEKNKEKVFNSFKEELRKDRSRTNILKISELGLVEMTRKRVRDSLQRTLCTACPYCEGRGQVKSTTSVSYEAMREVRRMRRAHKDASKFLINVHPDVVDILLDEERKHVEELERLLNVQLVMKGDAELHREGFEVVRL